MGSRYVAYRGRVEGVRIRLARDVEVGELAALVRAAYARYVDRMAVEPAPVSADYATLVSAHACRVAVTEDRVVGVLVLRPRGDHLLVENLAVLPEAQGRGVGGLLLERAEQEARSAGIDRIRLYTNVVMIENLAFYGRRGFRETGRRREGDFERVFLEKRLA
jgi:GNAT superfamily N-acetyltransferase